VKKEQKIIVICKLKLKQKFDMFLFIFTQTEKEGIELMSSLRSEQLSTVEIWLPIVQRNLTEWIRSNSDLKPPKFLPWSRGQPNGKDSQKCVAFERTGDTFQVELT
jgi:hypothetical protein